MAENRGLAYALADKVGALWSSDTFQQQVFNTEPTEFRTILAEHLEEVLKVYGAKSHRKPPPMPAQTQEPEPEAPPSHVTDSAARGLMENAPPIVRDTYSQHRKEGQTPAEALDIALKVYRELQEQAAMAQCAA